MEQTQRNLSLDSALLTTTQGSLASDWKRLVPVYAALGAGRGPQKFTAAVLDWSAPGCRETPFEMAGLGFSGGTTPLPV